MIDEADLTIVIAEKEQWPVYLKEAARSCSGTFQMPLSCLMILPTTYIERSNVGWSNWSPKSGKWPLTTSSAAYLSRRGTLGLQYVVSSLDGLLAQHSLYLWRVGVRLRL